MERSDDRLFWGAIGRDKENRKYEIHSGGKFSIEIDATKPGNAGNTCHLPSSPTLAFARDVSQC